jgi:hypothetical protein
VNQIDPNSRCPYADHTGRIASVSDLAGTPMKRVYGNPTVRRTARAVAPATSGHGRGAPTDTQATRATRKSGAIVKVLRSWIRPANSDAKAATTIVVQTENDTVTARCSCSLDGSLRARPSRTSVAATGTTPR